MAKRGKLSVLVLAFCATACHSVRAIELAPGAWAVPGLPGTPGIPAEDDFLPPSDSLGVGQVKTFSARPVDGSGETVEKALTVSVDDGSVVEIMPTTSATQFVIIGLAAGSTTFSLSCAGRSAIASVTVTGP